MAEQQKNKAWRIPKLVVIARSRSEERVLGACKATGNGASNAAAACLQVDAPLVDKHGDGFCDRINFS